MACKKCGGVAQQEFNGELSVSHRGIENLHQPPVYICNALLVCLDCGFAELTIPEPELESLRKRPAASHSQYA
jgi:hypothetical protein